MNYKELKELLRYEYRMAENDITDRSYHALAIDNYIDHNDTTAFNVYLCLHYNTTLFCTRTLIDRVPDYTVKKIVSVTYTGEVFQFNTVEEFVKYIGEIDIVKQINKY